MHLFYFAYGSNMNPARVADRGLSFVSHFSATLYDYRLAFNKASTKHPGAVSANVVAASGHTVEGVAYRLEHADEITRMDPFEGFPVAYSRRGVRVEHDGGSVEAWVYTANADYIVEGRKPARWYLDHLLRGRPYLSDEYYEWLTGIECMPGSHTEPT